MSVQGKTILITGATNGIGRSAALTLAKQGAHVVVHGRSQSKIDEVVGTITRDGGQAAGLRADVSTLDGMRSLAQQFRDQYTRLDVLINNAGGLFNDFQRTADGYEMTFALNHLSYFVVTTALLDIIKASAPARIVNVSSEAHRFGGRIDFTNLGKTGQGFATYGATKLMNVLFTFELARRLQGTGVTVNALHPGFVATGFGVTSGGIWSVLFGKIARPFAKTPEQGAATTVYLASSPAVEGVTGKYFSDSKPARPTAAAFDENAQRRLWELSEQIAGVTTAG